LNYGYKKDELIGKSLLEFIPEKYWPMINEHLADLAKGKSAQGELELKTKKGTVMTEFRSSPIKKRKKIVGFQSIVRDITQQKLIEEELRESEEKYSLIFENSPDGIITLDLMGNITSVNDVVLNYGYKKEDLIGKSYLGFIPSVPEKQRSILDKHVASIMSGKKAQGEMEFSTPKGRLTMWFRASPMTKGGEIVGFQIILVDITERKKAEETLKDSERKLRDIIDNSPDGIVWVDTTGKITLVNKKGFEITGFSEKELIGKNFMDVKALTEESKEKILESFMKRIEGIDTPPYEVELVTKNGEALPFELSASPIYEEDKIVGVQAVFRDLRERKKTEEKLRESEERLRDLYESVPDALAVYVGKEGHLIDYNKAFKKSYGYTDDELKDKAFLDFVHPDDRPLVLERYRTEYSEEDFPLVYEVRAVNKKGESFPIEISVGPYKQKGRVIGINVMHRDITERKAMEANLRESEERFRNLFESIQDPVGIFVGREGRLIDYNNAFKKLAGYTDEELKNKIFLDFVHPDDQALVLERYQTKYSEKDLPLVYEIRAVNKKGEIIPIEISVSPYKKKGKVIGIEIIHRNITERKKMERKLQEYAEHLEDMVEKRTKALRESQERLLKAERMAAIGQLATMVGHDLRNPLAAIQNASYYLKMKLAVSKDEKIKKMLAVIDNEINYANNIVKDLLDFSRVKKPELKKVDIISSIQDAVAQLKFPENITLITKFSEVPIIEADPDQLRRVFQNIALNGAQAMPDGGKLTVSTRKNGNFIEVTFRDTGAGIPEENMSKLFTPLFTTKAQGVGLGLPICKNLVECHNGRIEVKSKVGEGSTFTVKLPIPKSFNQTRRIDDGVQKQFHKKERKCGGHHQHSL
jgi:two-component system cell cycle sensor histidine kinase/response regulator CckA